MKILWLSPNGGNYKRKTVKGSGGWIGALQEELIRRYPDLELGLAFESSDKKPKKEGNISYFPICTKKSGKVSKIWGMAFPDRNKQETSLIKEVTYIINEYKPDVVHVWGVENTFASVIPYIKVPFVVHIQGLLSYILSVYLPPAFSELDFNNINPWWKPSTWVMKMLHFSQKDLFKDVMYRAEREIRVSKFVKNWIGRTEWDYHASQMLSPCSKYFHCEEIMRSEFNEVKWQFHHDNKVIKVQSSINETWYKGIDVILRTANVLKSQGVDVEWNVYGVERKRKLVNYMSKRLSIKPEDVGVHFMGLVSGEVIRDGLLSCDLYVHPSYIENSSNAIAEAMMLGVPTIAQYVGGNPTMLNEDSGILVPASAPYDLAFAIQQAKDRAIMEGYSERALKVSKNRQNIDKTIKNLISIYKLIAEQIC